MYTDACTSVKFSFGESKMFNVNVGVHQGSVLSPLLFIIVLDVISRNFRVGLPWELLYADDLALLAESEAELLEKIKRWKQGMEEKGLRVNIDKTKVLLCSNVKRVVVKWPCSVCGGEVGDNSIQCKVCKKWVHWKKCSKMPGKLRKCDFTCPVCSGEVEAVVSDPGNRVFDLGLDGSLAVVDSFCYLGDTIGASGGAEEACRTRVRCAWSKFRELMPILTSRGASLKLKGKIYRECVRSAMVYGSETWPMKADDLWRLVRTERMMVRWMCGVTLKDRCESVELLDRLGIEAVEDVLRRGRLRWFGHVERMKADNWVSACRSLEIVGGKKRGRGRGKKAWRECVLDDLRSLKLKREVAQERVSWRGAIKRKPKPSDTRKRGKHRRKT